MFSLRNSCVIRFMEAVVRLQFPTCELKDSSNISVSELMVFVSQLMLSFWSTWSHSRFLVRFVLLILCFFYVVFGRRFFLFYIFFYFRITHIIHYRYISRSVSANIISTTKIVLQCSFTLFACVTIIVNLNN